VKTQSKYKEEKPEEGDLVRIHYVAMLEDGKVFDSSRARGKVFEFNLGDPDIIDGWNVLIATMALGERSELTVPPEWAYGPSGSPPIVPPSATLTYDVELLDIGRPLDDDDDSKKAKEEEEKDDATILEETGLFWEQEEGKEGGKARGYTWEATGTGNEVCIDVPLPADVKVRDIKVDIKTFKLSCKIAQNTIIDGELFAGIDADISHWDIEKKGKGASLLIYLAKLKKEIKWDTLLADEKNPTEVVDVDAALEFANTKLRKSTDATLK